MPRAGVGLLRHRRRRKMKIRKHEGQEKKIMIIKYAFILHYVNCAKEEIYIAAERRDVTTRMLRH
jgi:hypothetical protein